MYRFGSVRGSRLEVRFGSSSVSGSSVRIEFEKKLFGPTPTPEFGLVLKNNHFRGNDDTAHAQREAELGEMMLKKTTGWLPSRQHCIEDIDGQGGREFPPEVNFLFNNVRTNFGLIYCCPPPPGRQTPGPPMIEDTCRKGGKTKLNSVP